MIYGKEKDIMKLERLRAPALAAFAIVAITTITFIVYRRNQKKEEENWYEKDIFNSAFGTDNRRA